MIEVAALYVDCPGIYYEFSNVDPWNEINNAKNYHGPYPVIAHPPCGPWGALKWNSYLDDKSTGPRAVEQVRTFGGILEHPARSSLFNYCNLPKPNDGYDKYGGYTIQVDQLWWGHPLQKRTWLYIVGISKVLSSNFRYIDFEEKVTHVFGHGSGKLGRIKRRTSELRELPDNQRAKTPPRLAKWLIELARIAKV
jgi:hypothetical protein